MLSILLPSGVSAAPAWVGPLAEQGVITFADLGMEEDLILHGPYDSSSLRFDLPPTWSLQSGSELELEISAYIVADNNLAQSRDNNFIGATLEVYFNSKLLQSIPLVNGDRMVYRVPILPEALLSKSDAGWHDITFFLDAAVDCDFDFHKTTVSVSMNSKASFSYEQIPLSLDLRRLPWPIFQERRKIKDPVTLVIPAAPSADELQAALVMMGSFARMTSGDVPINMITFDQLTDEIQNQSHLLMVGKPAGLPLLKELSLPVPLNGDQFLSRELTTDDGVIQILPSPFNSEKVVLVVSGATDQGVVKAAQAVSTANLQTGDKPDYSIAAEVNPASSIGILGTDLSQFNSPDIFFSDLGFESITSTGLGTNWQSFGFIIPPGQIPEEGPYLDLKYTTSELVDPNRSEGVVYLNDIRIGSLSFDSETTNLATTRINLPASALRSGVNNLDVVMNLLPRDDCSLLAFSGLWVTVYSDSLLHLPLTQAPESFFALQDIRSYPYPFSNDPTLGTTTFVLSQKDFSSWAMAGRIAYDLGARVPGPVLAFDVLYDGQIAEDQRAHNFIIVGEPRGLPVLSEFQSVMPAYYETESNVAVLDSQQVVYRISESKDLGYLQLFSSPWDVKWSVLGIFGTSPNGIAYAVDALLNVNSRELLAGNFATLDGENAIVADTRSGLGIGRIGTNLGPSVSVEESPTPAGTSQVVQTNLFNRQLIFAGVLGVILLMLVVVIVALRLRKRSL